ncbi:ankyrin and het domain protein [Colletotrichum kahawae]|uniref:Ankyrin and het domain protein n=1 Tax=Colletotrichum kahawae TaxID=34407 RepID=A0AAE0DEM5_COLKA|nr:ankyrin and het domain protein [Colletotrichum kahawae]
MAEVLEMLPQPPQQSLALRPAPSTTKSFAISEYQYKPLAPGEIRMLILLPGDLDTPLQGYISHENLDQPDCKFSYEALSYVWGSQADPKPFHVLECSSQSSSAEVKTLKIGQNLESALRHLRQTSGTRTIWCDAICINQNDVEERGVQVRGMGDIYSHAKRVVVWLGQETDDLYRAAQCVKFLGSIFYLDRHAYTCQQYSDTTDSLAHPLAPMPFKIADSQSLFDFFDLPWFKRLWVKQEIILAKGAAIFVIGKQEFTWDDFCGGASYLMNIGIPHSEAFGERKRQDFRELLMKAWMTFSYGESRHIYTTLRLVNECECLDPRDKIYGILGLHREALQIVEPNYNKDHRDVYTDFSRQYMQSTIDMGTFAFCDTADDTTWMHPTWVPDFAKRIPQIAYWCTGNVAKHLQPQYQILSDDSCKVLGIYCGTISQCSSSVTPQKVVPSTCFEIIRSWILDVSSNRSQPFSQACIDELVCTISLGAIKEHNLECPWTSTEVTDILLGDMEWFSPQESRREESKGILMSNFINNGIGGNLLATTADGRFARSVGTTQVGDEIYVFPGEDVPIVLRKIEGGRYRVVGPCFMPSLMCREALLGQLPEGWKVQFGWKTLYGVITDLDGQIQSEDPRLGELPPGWESEPDDDGHVWYRYGPEGVWSLYDPRLTPERLADRGVKFEELIIV